MPTVGKITITIESKTDALCPPGRIDSLTAALAIAVINFNRKTEIDGFSVVVEENYCVERLNGS